MAGMALVAFTAALLIGAVSGATVTGRSPETLGNGGGVTLYIYGEGFSEDQFNHNDIKKGNKVYLVNEKEEIECKVITYYTTTQQIACVTGRRTTAGLASNVYAIVVYVDGVRVEGPAHTVKYGWWRSPYITRVAPRWALPGTMITLYGGLHTSKYYQMDLNDPTSSNPDSGNYLTKAYIGGTTCELVDENDELLGTLTSNQLTCRPTAKLIGPMNATFHISNLGLADVKQAGLRVDSQDKIYQFHTYPSVDSVSPSSGSTAGGSLITITGLGFDPYNQQTKVEVGGGECVIEHITDDEIQCLTPSQQHTSPGPGERGLLVELYEGQYFDTSFDMEGNWASLSPSLPGYTSFVTDVPELNFPIDITQDTVGTVKGYLHVPHDGLYGLSASAGDNVMVLVAGDGNPDSKVQVSKWEEFSAKKGLPVYVEIRFQARAATEFQLGMKDFNTRFGENQVPSATNEEQQVTLDITQVWEKQSIEVTGTPGASAALFLNGFTSSLIDITDPAKVREEVLDMTEQKCDSDFSGVDVMHHTGFEDDTLPPGCRGSFVNDVTPYCGRRSFRLNRDEPQIYKRTEEDNMLDANTYRYICFAISGKASNSMSVTFMWKKSNENLQKTVFFEREFPATGWTYWCEDLVGVLMNSDFADDYKIGSKLLIKDVLLPKPLKPGDGVYVDEVSFLSAATDVIQTRPSALRQQGILLQNVVVRESNSENKYSLQFITANCVAGMPLLAVVEGNGDNSLIEVMKDVQSYDFPIGDAVVKVNREAAATSPLTGTWDLRIQGRLVKDIPADVDSEVLEKQLQSALGTGFSVARKGSCRNYYYTIKWLTDPGRKELSEVDKSNLLFDGEMRTQVSRAKKGHLNHVNLATDFVTTHRDLPHVTVRVNGYSAACSGDCGFTYNDAKTPTLTSVSGTPGTEQLQHTVTLTGTGFTSTTLGDYSISVGDRPCSPVAVTPNTQVVCEVSVWGGEHPVSLSMQPAGKAVTLSPITYTVAVTVTELSKDTGGTGGLYPLTVTGSGFPDSDGWQAGAAKVFMGDKECLVTSGDPTQVTCTVPAGEGVVDVSVVIGETSTSLQSSFTYDFSLSPTISDTSLPALSVYGQEELTISGSSFGLSGSAKIGTEPCDITNWSDTSVTCLTPSLSPNTYTLTLLSDNMGAAVTSVEYVLRVTSASALKGSVKGGSLVKVGGTGFGSECSRLEVRLGDQYQCEVTECSQETITCITAVVPSTHHINSIGSTTVDSVSWSPAVMEVVEGDLVTWYWNKLSENSQLKYSVCEVASPLDDCDSMQGFTSGAKTASGSLTVRFPQEGTYYYSGLPVSSDDNDLVMRGQINVVRPQHQALKVTVTLGDKEATYQVTGEEVISVDGCDKVVESPIDGCEAADSPTSGDDGFLYFQAHICHTPVINTITSPSVHTVPGISGVQVLAGDSVTITGSGFGDLPCQVEVKVGDAACTVTSTSDTSVTCDLDDLDNLRSSAYLPLTLKVINRGIAVLDVGDYDSLGRLLVLPQVSGMTPVEGSMAGGTLVTITGSGLQGLSSDPVVRLGATPCQVQSVSPSTVTCLTPASASASSASVSVFVGGVEAKMDNALTFTYSEALTPLVTGMSVEGEVVTLSGQRLGGDTSKLTVTMERQTDVGTHRDLQMEEENVMMEDEVLMMSEHYLDDLMMSDEELEYLTNGYIDQEMADAIHRERSARHHKRQPKLSLVDELEALDGFWGTFTGTGASSFEETVRLGAWRMAGTAPSPKTEGQGTQETPTRKKRSLEDLPTSYSCTVNSVTGNEASATCSGLPAGSYTPVVTLEGAGNAMVEGVSAIASAVVASVTPSSGSMNGGALLTITGSGFIPGDTSVEVGEVACIIEEESAHAVSCRVAPGSEGSAAVVVKMTGSDDITAPSQFTYSSDFTPTLTSVTPSESVVSGDTLTLTGTGFALSDADPVVTVGGHDCVLLSSSETSLKCTAPEVGAGSYEVVVRDTIHGDSNTQTVTFTITINSITPSSGSYGGAAITVTGQGFDGAGDTTVTICDLPCALTTTTATSTIACVAPKQTLSDSTKECDVVVSVPGGSSFTLPSGFTYDPTLTPSITSVEPKRGGTAGGTTLTITGAAFGSSGNIVNIGGSSCEVTDEGPSSITCVTGAHQGSGRFEVQITLPGSGLATTDDNGIFYYIDLWSSVYTWDNEPVPSKGQLAVVSEGQTILLDESTPVLKMLLIQGGHLMFDSEAAEELVLRAEYILVVDGGSLSIGSEEEPFLGPAVIELYGNTQSIELPIYGAKVLAVRHGTLDLHGAHVPITWTHLAQTASPGDTTITLTTPVTWKTGDDIVIATTQMRFYRNENEVRTIASVSDDGLTVTLTEALEYPHVSLTQTLGGRTVHTRAEVGLLTRNIKIRGAVNSDFTEFIRGCEEEFSPDQHATQSCYNGRYGDEIGSDQFGATVMLFGKFPDQELVMGRFEYVEVTEAGQAFQLGRYPLHFHLVGKVDTSYIRGCAIHRTYNRAVTIHAANYLTVEHNVVYDNMGHAIFTEDGVEQNNVVQYNLAVYTRSSSSLLNVDVTPSSFWVVNPNNIFRHNAAAGGTHFGYWYRLERHPSGPSATNTYCPNNEQMGQFFNNTAHSMGRYGLWVFSNNGYNPKFETCKGKNRIAKWEGFTAWHCERGAEVVSGTNLQFHDFVVLDNELAGMEMVTVKGSYGEDDGSGIFNGLVACHSALNSGACTKSTSGIVSPKASVFSVADVTFVNFDADGSAAFSGCSQCRTFQGGFTAQVKGLNFESSPNKIKFLWEHETIWIDADGSLTGEAEANVVPSMNILPPDSCKEELAFSVAKKVPGSVCRGGMKFLRFNIEGPKTSPQSLVSRDLVVSNQFGTTYVPYMLKRLTVAGWMGILYTKETYDWAFQDSQQITDISYKATTRFLTPGDYFYVRHTFMHQPDAIATTADEREGLESVPDPDTNFHGDFYWNDDERQLTYMVSHKGKNKKNARSIVFEQRRPGIPKSILFETNSCQYEGCVSPATPEPGPTEGPEVVGRWSDVETWKWVPVGSGGHPTETEYNLPVEGDEIVIPKGMWLIVDAETPKLGRVSVYGTLEFEDSRDHVFDATIIYIQGGAVIGGASPQQPFINNLVIRLRGSLDPDDTDNYPMAGLGWKALGVFGDLKLHGTVTGKTWYKLGATAEPGATTITLAEQPDASWLGKTVVVTTTAKEAKESEVRQVTAVNGATLTLDTALSFQHLGETHTLDEGLAPITLAGEVGLLSHNIVVEGNTYDNFAADSFGGRILVSKRTVGGVEYVGSAQLDGVELRNMGQEGFTDLDDPRYSLAFLNLGTIDSDSSYVKRSSFNLNYNVALGLLGTSSMQVEDNVIYHALDAAVRDESGSNSYLNNLITTVLFAGTYQDRMEEENYNWNGAFQLDNAPNTVLSGNVVAGAEQAGYKTLGEPCQDVTLWQNNEVHNAIYGVMTWKKGSMGPVSDCRRFNNFYAWRIASTAFYYQFYASPLIMNVVSVDNRLGVNQLVYKPGSLSHVAYPKTASITHSLFVAASPSHTCDFQTSKSDILKFYGGKFYGGSVDGGNAGVQFGSFTSGSNMAPKMDFYGAGTYPALYGSTHIKDVTFYNFGNTDCGRDIALLAHPQSEDAIHPVFVEGLKFHNTPEDNYLFIPRPQLSSVDPSDCVDMDCDGHKKVVVRDLDGSFLGVSEATAISQAEYEWDGDARHGVGDYRIPVSLRQKDDGTKIDAADKFPNKGIVRDESCSLVPSWQAWKCTSLSHRMMVIESMDSDTEVRRLSPIALIANPGPNGYVDLLNGPMDRGWCAGYTCQERISTFYSVVAAGQTYEMAMTSTPPQVLRFHLLHAPPSETVILRIFFPKTQRYDIYVDDLFVPPTNLDNSKTSYQLLPENPDDPEAFFPTLNDDVGTNYLQRSAKMVHVVLRGGHVVDIKTTPMIALESGLVVAEEDFYEENLLSHLADLFGVSPENIRITNIVSESSNRRTGTVVATVSAEVASAPTSSLSDDGDTSGATGGDVMSYDDLVKSVEKAVNTYQEKATDDVQVLKVNDPVEPPKEAPPKATEETGSIVTEDGGLFSDKQQKEEQEELEKSLEPTEYAQPSSAVVVDGVPSVVVQYTAFVMQPSVSVLDDKGEVILNLGHKSDPWRVTAQLSGGPDSAVLLGTTTVPYVDGAATFHDLSVSEPGEHYHLTFTVTYPSDAPALTAALDQSFSATAMSVGLEVEQPSGLVQVDQPTAVTLQFLDKDSGLPLNDRALQGQSLVGELLAKKNGDEDFQVIHRTYVADTTKATVPLEGITFDEPSVRYQLLARVAVVPAGWYMEATLPRVVVYPSSLVTQLNSGSWSVSTNLHRWKMLEGVEEQLEDGVLEELMRSVDMMSVGVYWGPVTVELGDFPAKKGNAIFTVTGPKTHVAEALKMLCLELSTHQIIPVKNGCGDTHYRIKKVFVSGKVMNCGKDILERLRRSAVKDAHQRIHSSQGALAVGGSAPHTMPSMNLSSLVNLGGNIFRDTQAPLSSALSTRMSKTLVLEYPEVLQAGHPLTFTLHIMAGNTEPLEAQLLQDQKVLIELLGKNGEEDFQAIKRLYLENLESPSITIEDVIIQQPSVRYQLAAKVSVVPAKWYLHFVSPRLEVYPDHLVTQDTSITQALQVYIMKKHRSLEGVESQLEDAVMTLVMERVDMMADGVYWGPATLTAIDDGNKKGIADFTVTGPEDKVKAAREKLCSEVRARVAVKVNYNCKDYVYYVKTLLMDGEAVGCAKKNKNRHSEETVVLHQPSRIVRHKFNRG